MSNVIHVIELHEGDCAVVSRANSEVELFVPTDPSDLINEAGIMVFTLYDRMFNDEEFCKEMVEYFTQNHPNVLRRLS